MLIDIKKYPYLVVFITLNTLVFGCDSARQSDPAGPEILPGAARLSDLLGAQSEQDFPLVTAPRRFSFPADHGPHPEYRNEWWYTTGNLDGVDGERFGFELTFFRFALTPHDQGQALSAWSTNQVYVAHFAVTDAANDEFYVAQRYARGAVGLAGSTSNPFRVWLEDWSIGEAGNENATEWRLIAKDDDMALDLRLSPLKSPVLNGEDGLSQKSDLAGNASYYFSMTRLAADGSLSVGNRSYEVDGLTWLDREWGSSALSADQRGWDWFAIQLSDGSDLMFYNIRRNDGSADDHSSGTWVDRHGNSTILSNQQVHLRVDDYWESDGGDMYPARWSVIVPTLGLTLRIEPILDDQELVTNVRYWEGAVDVRGRLDERDIDGRGYVELTGYAH